MVKTCTNCQETQDLSNFYKQKYGKFGHASVCKKCMTKKYRVQRTLYRTNNIEKQREYSKTYYYKNKDRLNQICKEFVKSLKPGVYFVKANNGTYIGQSKAMLRRKWDHDRDSNKLTPVDKVLEFKILEVVEDKDLRLKREQYWIDKLKPTLNALV